jgi:FimV-like protein
MKTQLKRIFDTSSCLTRKQLKLYSAGTMSREECHAVEHHLNSCLLCSESLDGVLANKGSFEYAERLNNNFLKDHFSITHPHVHLNSIAPAAHAPVTPRRVRHQSSEPLVKPSGIMAVLLLIFGALWYMEYGQNQLTRAINLNKESRNTTGSAASAGKETTPAATVKVYKVEDQPVFPMNSSTQPMEKVTASSAMEMTTGSTAGFSEKKGSQDGKKEIPTSNNKIISSLSPVTPSGLSGNSAENPPKLNPKQADGNNNNSVKAIAPISDNNQQDKTAKKSDSEDKAEALPAGDENTEETESSRAKQLADLNTAKDYLKNGQKESAKKLLETLVNEGRGGPKRQAKRMLNDINADTAQ